MNIFYKYSSIWCLLVVANLVLLNQCTTTKQTPQQTIPCSEKGYVHIDSLNALRALKQAEINNLHLGHVIELDEMQDYYEDKVDSTIKNYLKVDTIFREIIITRPFGDCQLNIHFNGRFHPTSYSESDSMIIIRCFPFTKF